MLKLTSLTNYQGRFRSLAQLDKTILSWAFIGCICAYMKVPKSHVLAQTIYLTMAKNN